MIGKIRRMIGKIPKPPEHEENLALGRKIQRGRKVNPDPEQPDTFTPAAQKAVMELARRNIGLIGRQAGKYSDRGVDYEDLFQEGWFGLVRAAERYDPTLGWRFSTYAFQWVRQAVVRAIDIYGRDVRVPVGVSEQARKVGKRYLQLRNDLGRPPTPEEMATLTGLSVATLAHLRTSVQPIMSLDHVAGDDEADRRKPIDELEANGPDVVNDLLVTEMRERAMTLVATLGERERFIVTERYVNGRTLEEVGGLLKLSRERIRQLEARILAALRRDMLRDDGQHEETFIDQGWRRRTAPLLAALEQGPRRAVEMKVIYCGRKSWVGIKKTQRFHDDLVRLVREGFVRIEHRARHTIYHLACAPARAALG